MRKISEKQLKEERELLVLMSEEATCFKDLAELTGLSYDVVNRIKKNLTESELQQINTNFTKNKSNVKKVQERQRINDVVEKSLKLAKTGKFVSQMELSKQLNIPRSTLSYHIRKSRFKDEIMEYLEKAKNARYQTSQFKTSQFQTIPVKDAETKKSKSSIIKTMNGLEPKKQHSNVLKDESVVPSNDITFETIKLNAERVKIGQDNKEKQYSLPVDRVVIDTSVMGVPNIREILDGLFKRGVKVYVIDPVLVELDCLSKDKINQAKVQKAKVLIRYIFNRMHKFVFCSPNGMKELTVDEKVIELAKKEKAVLFTADMIQSLRAGIANVDFRCYAGEEKDVTFVQYFKPVH